MDSSRNIHHNRDIFGNFIHDHIWVATGRNSCKYNYGEAVYAVAKKQIGKRMIRKIEKFLGE